MNRTALNGRGGTLISGSSQMACLIRSFNWTQTSLGPIEEWSDTLLASTNLMLHSPFPTILTWGSEMVFLYNDAAISTLAAKHPAALGGLYRVVFQEAWDLVGGDLEACFYRGKTAVRDNLLIPIVANGEPADHYWNYSLIPVYENGWIAGVYDVFRNVTATVRGAKRLQDTEARLKLVTDAGQLGVFVWDTIGDKASWENDRVYDIFARSRELGPINGAEFLRDVLHCDYRDMFRQAVERTVQRGEPFYFEGPVYLPDRSLRRVEIRGNLQQEPDAPEGRILGTVRDVTAIRQTEEALNEGNRHLGQLAAIVDSSDDVIVSKDLNGIVKSWNASATRVFGYSAEEMIGESILKLIPEHLHGDEKVIIESIKAGRRLEHFDTVRKAKDGRLIDVSLTVSPIRDADGRIIGASKILRDISSRKLMEQSLLQAEKIAATGRMAATIAHEINNPLEAIVNLLYLTRSLITDPVALKYIASAEEELARVSHIAKQTLGYYREHASASCASLSDIARHALTVYEPRCMAAGITVSKSFESSRKVMLRRGEMTQVISNLIMNSIYAMPAGGTLSISVADTEFPSEGVVLAVSDDGVGIPPQIMPKVFDAFFTTRHTVGTGIGLFIAKQFVDGHAGRISIESKTECEEHGTTVRVFLPANTAYAGG